MRLLIAHTHTPTQIHAHSKLACTSSPQIEWGSSFLPITPTLLFSLAHVLRHSNMLIFLYVLRSLLGVAWLGKSHRNVRDIISTHNSFFPPFSLSSSLDMMDWIQANMRSAHFPFLLLHGTKDKICTIKGSELFYDNAPSKDKHFIRYAPQAQAHTRTRPLAHKHARSHAHTPTRTQAYIYIYTVFLHAHTHKHMYAQVQHAQPHVLFTPAFLLSPQIRGHSARAAHGHRRGAGARRHTRVAAAALSAARFLVSARAHCHTVARQHKMHVLICRERNTRQLFNTIICSGAVFASYMIQKCTEFEVVFA